jgi:hypothetical protein
MKEKFPQSHWEEKSLGSRMQLGHAWYCVVFSATPVSCLQADEVIVELKTHSLTL